MRFRKGDSVVVKKEMKGNTPHGIVRKIKEVDDMQRLYMLDNGKIYSERELLGARQGA
ncbi:hypothetical protein SEA_ALONE_47 [Streptomyces phage Alone3]|nr:hypothetical protein SEA_ALONE_47 [Streptomyces phage Alone3]